VHAAARPAAIESLTLEYYDQIRFAYASRLDLFDFTPEELEGHTQLASRLNPAHARLNMRRERRRIVRTFQQRMPVASTQPTAPTA
jgi:hypothetical protein